MREFVKRLNLPIEVTYVPDPSSPKHGEIKDSVIVISDANPETAWITMLHEVVEWRLRPVLKIYRDAVNSLISLLEQVAYREKEQALSSILNDFMVWRSLDAERLDDTRHKAKRSESIDSV